MSKEFINLDQIAKSIREKVDLPFPQCQKIIREINNVIGDELKAKGKVRLHDFGLFYLGTRKSRLIYQIRTKEKRLLLEQTLIKFISSPIFKRRLSGKTAPYGVMSKPKQKQVSEGDKIEVFVAPKPSKKINLPPYSLMHPVDPESVRQKILDRIKKIRPVEKIKRKLEINLPTSLNLSASAEGKAFYSLFKQMQHGGLPNIAFTISNEKVVSLYSGRPQKKIGSLPRGVVERFLNEHLEIHGFDIPQERFAKIDLGRVCFVRVYSIPTNDGASVYMKLEG